MKIASTTAAKDAKVRVAVEIDGRRFALVPRNSKPVEDGCRACHARRYCKGHQLPTTSPAHHKLCLALILLGSGSFWAFKRVKSPLRAALERVARAAKDPQEAWGLFEEIERALKEEAK